MQRNSIGLRRAAGASLVVWLVVSGCATLTPAPGTPLPPPSGAGRFAFVSSPGSGAEADLYLMNADGSGLAKIDLGSKAWMIDHLAWSADGQRLAFVAFLLGDGENTQGLFTLQADGAGLTEIIRTQGNIEYSWSPDGKRLAYQVGRVELNLASADGSQRLLLESAQVDSYAWSPDSQYVLLTTGENVTYIDGVDGTKRTAASGVDVMGFAWSPDGKQIALSGRDETTEEYGLFVMKTDSPVATRIVSLLQQIRSPHWLPDGQRIVFEAGDIFMVGADGSGLSSLVTGELFVGDFAWSPDGQQIAFLAGGAEYGQYDLYLMKADGSDQKRLTDKGALYPAWSPDGKRLLFTSAPEFSQIEPYPPEVVLYAADASTHAVAEVLTYKRTDMNQSRPMWSLDGQTIVFASDASEGGTTIQTVGSGGATPVQLAGPVGTLRQLVWYPTEMASNLLPLFRR